MRKTINFKELATEEAKKASDIWQQKTRDQILGKTISFIGMAWNTGRHSWEAYTVEVQKVLENRSGNPFNSEIEFQGIDGNIYTIHPDYNIDILG
jgi:hypothetical protein